MEDNRLDQLFKDSLGNHQSELASSSWDRLEFMLDAKDEVKVEKKNKNENGGFVLGLQREMIWALLKLSFGK